MKSVATMFVVNYNPGRFNSLLDLLLNDENIQIYFKTIFNKVWASETFSYSQYWEG